MKKTLFTALLLLVTGINTVSAQTSASSIENKKQTIFYCGNTSDAPYRIPAIATLKNGNILAIADYRPDKQDVGGYNHYLTSSVYDVDIYAKIGTKNSNEKYSWTPSSTHPAGETGNPGRIIDGKSTSDKIGFGDAAVVVDRESGDILVMCVGAKISYGDTSTSSFYNCYRITSNDNGQSWSTPAKVENLRGSNNILTGSNNVKAMFFASGRLLQSKKKASEATHCRVYGALLVRIGSSSVNYVVYSDDFGANWELLGTKGSAVVSSANEAKLEELPNGSIVISSRKSGGRYFNVFNFTDWENAVGTWEKGSDKVGSTNFGDNISDGADTNGEILLYPGIDADGNRVNILFQSLPIDDDRSKVSVYYKAFDANKSSWTVSDFTSDWTKGIQIDDNESAYSTMTILPDGNIGFLYEDEYSTSNAKGGRANIKFIPLTLSEITGGAYKNASYNITLNECTVGGEDMALATFSAPVSTLCPGGVSAYYIKDMNNGYAKLEAIGEGKTIPANTGVILAAEEAGSYTMTGVGDFVDATIGDNLLVGSSNSTVTFSNTVKGYILMGDGDGGVAFYSAQENTTLGKNKAYLKLDTPASSTGVRISFDGTTDIEFVEHEQEDAEPVIYDLYGRRVNEMQPGNIYIVNGKKILKK